MQSRIIAGVKNINFITNQGLCNKNNKNFNPIFYAMKEPQGLLSRQNQIKIQFSMKIKVAKNCFVLRFLLPDENLPLGINICQHVILETQNSETKKIIKKPYQIISTDEDKGVIDILIKVYNQKENNSEYGFFSNYLADMEQGQVISLSGPYGSTKYYGSGFFEYKKDDIFFQKRFNKIGMIAGGTGIAPMFQLIQSLVNPKFKERKLGISLLYATKSLEDMAFCEDLALYDAKGKISFFPVVEMPHTQNWTYGSGLVTPEMITNLMPSPKDEEAALLICGPRGMINDHLLPMFDYLGYKKENIIIF